MTPATNPTRLRMAAWGTVVLFAVVSVLALLPLRRLEVDPELKHQLPPDLPSLSDARAIDRVFGGAEMLTVALQAQDVLAPSTLERLRALTLSLGKVQGVRRVLSPFTLNDISLGADGELLVGPAVDGTPSDVVERERLRARLAASPLLIDNVISRDFDAASVILVLAADANETRVLESVREVISQHPGSETLLIGGMPEVRRQVSDDIAKDVRRFAPAGLLVMFIFLFVALRQWRGVLIPLCVQVMALVVSLSLVPLLGWKMHVVTVTLPVLLLAIGNDHSVHLIAAYQEENATGQKRSPLELTRAALKHMGLPIVVAGITTVAGFMCLMGHDVVPIAQLGFLAAAGLVFVMLASLTLVPALLLLLPAPLPHAAGARAGWLDRALSWNARWVTKHKSLAIVGSLSLAVVAAAGLPRLEVDTNPINYYPRSSPVARTAHVLNDEFGGASEISVMIEGDIQDPHVLAQIDAFERGLNALPEVGATSSMAQLVRRLNLMTSAGNTASDTIPAEREAISQLLLLYTLGGDTESLERLVDFDYRHALVSARINSTSTREVQAVVDRVRLNAKEQLAGLAVTVGGGAVVFADLVGAVVDGQVSSLAWSLLVVFVLNSLGFRSLWAGAWTMLPLALAVPGLFGSMAYASIELNIVTAMLSSIMIGVGVDYTVHFLWRYRERRRLGFAADEAARQALTSVGRGIVFNALAVVLGFSVLGLSGFLPVRFFGFLVVVSIVGCLLAALVLMPPLMAWLDPRFARPQSPASAPRAAEDQAHAGFGPGVEVLPPGS